MIGLILAIAASGMPMVPQTDVASVLDGLSGHCWRGELAGGLYDIHCFKVLEQGLLGTDIHIVRDASDKAVYEGITVYQSSKTGIRALYAMSLGRTMTWEVERIGEEMRYHGDPEVRWTLKPGYYLSSTTDGVRRFERLPDSVSAP